MAKIDDYDQIFNIYDQNFMLYSMSQLIIALRGELDIAAVWSDIVENVTGA